VVAKQTDGDRPEEEPVNPAVELDPSEKLRAYTHPERLVTTSWLADHLDDPNLVVAESDEDVLLYDTGHLPGAVKIDWHLDLNDPVERDYVDAEGFARLMSSKGISRDTTIVFYGDNFNWWAAYALWVCTLFGHEDVRLLDGGRQTWVEEGRPLTTEVPNRPTTDYPLVQRDDTRIRAFREQVLDHVGAGGRLVDVRSPGEYSGELLAMPDYPQEGALRGGHIYEGELGLTNDDDIIAYCRIGERSSHTWFVLSQLLGFPRVRNYDGSWVEWGNSVRVPIERSREPGPDPRLKAVG
jgi:thiosulfate/3-mercaptopyruvate sulfurtransferase